jgi:Transposase IS116/IS110/IS902 family
LEGCGALSAAKIVGEAAGAGRFKSRAAFARWNGTAPVPVWSGATRFRLSRGGNRQINAALHRIALTQCRGIGPGRAYLDTRLAAGDSQTEAMRMLPTPALRWPAMGTAARPGAGAARAWLAAVSREVAGDDLALIDAVQVPIGRPGQEVRQRARSEPAVKVLTQLPGVGPVTALVILAGTGDASRFGSARKLAAWAELTPTVPGPGPHRPPRAHPQTGLGLAAVDCVRGRADRQTPPRLRRQLPGHRPPPREEDRHHRDRPQAAGPRHHLLTDASCGALTDREGPQPPGELAFSHEPALPRSIT